MKSSKTSLFLMELIIVILFFSICGAVCVQLFMHTHLTDKETELSSKTNLIIQNMAEVFYSCDGDLEACTNILDGAYLQSNDSIMCIDYDENFNVITNPTINAFYSAMLSISEPNTDASQGTIQHAEITIYSINQDSTSSSESSTSTMLLDSQELDRYIPLSLEKVYLYD